MLLGCVQVIPLAQQIAQAHIIGRPFEQQWLVRFGCDLGHLAKGGGCGVEAALQHPQPGEVGDRSQRSQQVMRSTERRDHGNGACFDLVPHIAVHTEGPREMQHRSRPGNRLALRQQA